MEGLSVSVYKTLKSYWERRNYKKLNGCSCPPPPTRVDLGSTQRRRRFRRVKITRKIRLIRRTPFAKKLVVWVRDAYVNMMLGFSTSRVFCTGYSWTVASDEVGAFVQGPLNIVEIYKLPATEQRYMVTCDTVRHGSYIVYRRRR